MIKIARKIYKSLLSEDQRLTIYKIRNPRHFQRMRRAINPSDKGNFSLRPFDQHRCIFVHVTKTAGTSVARSLFGYLPYHYTARQYRVIYGRKTFHEYYKFAFVRNPWDRLFSAYRYLKAGGWNDQDAAWAQDNLADYPDFDSFVMGWLSAENIRKHIHFWPQSDFLCDTKGKLLVDFVGRFECLHDDFRRSAAKLGIDAQLSAYNRNPGGHYSAAYTESMRSVVAEIYAHDIDKFDYRFEN